MAKTMTDLHIENRHPDCACVACVGVTRQPAEIVVSAWMLSPGDVIGGRTVRFVPVYTDPAKTHVRVDYTDGTRETFGHRADVTVTVAGE